MNTVPKSITSTTIIEKKVTLLPSKYVEKNYSFS